MIWYRDCPRCNGQLKAVQDSFGVRIVCWQCGWQQEVNAPAPQPLKREVPIAYNKRRTLNPR